MSPVSLDCPFLIAPSVFSIVYLLPPLACWVIETKNNVLDTTLCDKVCQWLATGRWFSPGTPDTSTNNTDRHDKTEILLKVALNTITLTITPRIIHEGPYVFGCSIKALWFSCSQKDLKIWFLSFRLWAWLISEMGRVH
jgi:hypothetical protein